MKAQLTQLTRTNPGLLCQTDPLTQPLKVGSVRAAELTPGATGQFEGGARLGLLAAAAPLAAAGKPTMRRALAPDHDALVVLGRNGGAGLAALGRALRATPAKRWGRVCFRVTDVDGRPEVEACDRTALALHFAENDLASVAHEVRHRRVAPGSALLLVESDGGIAVQTFEVGRLLRVLAKDGAR